MTITHIPATADEISGTREEIMSLPSRPAHLPPDADLTPVLPVPGDWVTAPGASDGVTLYAHGGGFAYTDPASERLLAYRLSQATGRAVLRVDYRLAPEHPYPAALEDVVAAYRGLLDQGMPASRIILAGESAGATLVLSALLSLKESGGPLPAGAVVISPFTDLTLSSPSMTSNDGQDLVDRAVLDHIRTQYLGGAEPDRAPQSPLYGPLHGLPPLLIAVGSGEVLLDDARRFAEAVGSAGGSVRLDVYEGMPHGFHATALSGEPSVGGVLLRRIREWITDPVREFTVSDPDAGPYALTAGPDGALWFTLVHRGAIGRRAPDGTLTTYPLETPGTGPTVITPGPDGALWFTEYQGHRIGRITVDGEVSSFDLPTPGAGPFGIAAGSDGALWFTETNAGRIGRITVEGKVSEYDLPLPGAFPSAIAAGTDGAMWFTLNAANAIGRITVDGAVTVHPLPTEAAAPVGITAGGDGAMWFVEIAAGQIGRITRDGDISEFPLPDREARPHAIVTGPDGACWFTEWGAGRIGRITPDGRVDEYDLPTAASEPHGIAVGPDGGLWAALETGALARITRTED
jgi:virginiamycin B lyase